MKFMTGIEWETSTPTYCLEISSQNSSSQNNCSKNAKSLKIKLSDPSMHKSIRTNGQKMITGNQNLEYFTKPKIKNKNNLQHNKLQGVLEVIVFP